MDFSARSHFTILEFKTRQKYLWEEKKKKRTYFPHTALFYIYQTLKIKKSHNAFALFPPCEIKPCKGDIIRELLSTSHKAIHKSPSGPEVLLTNIIYENQSRQQNSSGEFQHILFESRSLIFSWKRVSFQYFGVFICK